MAFSQNGKWTISQIDSIAKGIDTMRDLTRSIVEGTIKIKGGGPSKGAFTNQYFVRSSPVNVMKVIHEQSLLYLDLDTYYFIDDNLILVKTGRRQPGDSTSVATMSGSFYFHDGNVTGLYNQQTPANPTFLMERARSHLKHRDEMHGPLK
jgi:hypothetical protein